MRRCEHLGEQLGTVDLGCRGEMAVHQCLLLATRCTRRTRGKSHGTFSPAQSDRAEMWHCYSAPACSVCPHLSSNAEYSGGRSVGRDIDQH